MASGQRHVTPLGVYLKVATALLILTAITVTVSQFNLGEWNTVVAMVIAGTKAVLVAFFFMHLWYDNKLFFMIFGSALVFLAIFILLTMYDTQWRGQIYKATEKPIDPKAIIYQNTPDTSKAAIPKNVEGTVKATGQAGTPAQQAQGQQMPTQGQPASTTSTGGTKTTNQAAGKSPTGKSPSGTASGRQTTGVSSDTASGIQDTITH